MLIRREAASRWTGRVELPLVQLTRRVGGSGRLCDLPIRAHRRNPCHQHPQQAGPQLQDPTQPPDRCHYRAWLSVGRKRISHPELEAQLTVRTCRPITVLPQRAQEWRAVPLRQPTSHWAGGTRRRLNADQSIRADIAGEYGDDEPHRTTDLARVTCAALTPIGPRDVGRAEHDSVRVGSSTRTWSKTSGARWSMLVDGRPTCVPPTRR